MGARGGPSARIRETTQGEGGGLERSAARLARKENFRNCTLFSEYILVASRLN